ncbi:MAG: hypothetical protein ACJ74Z_16225 [Bryobacteraceae bacterium]|jgi:hypothetical protein
MSAPSYPKRGAVPWDGKLKAYIDHGDAGGTEGPAGPTGLPGVPGGNTVQSMWTWEVVPASAPMARGLIGVMDPPPRTATDLVTSCYDLHDANHLETIQALLPGDRIHLLIPDNPDSWHIYEVIDLPVDQGSDTYAIPVETYDGSSPATAPTEPISVLTAFQFMPRPGPPGPQGPAGPSGSAGGSSYIHNQIAVADVWVIMHSLGRYPSVTVVDSGGSVVFPDIHYDDANQVTVVFGSLTSGKVYLS